MAKGYALFVKNVKKIYVFVCHEIIASSCVIVDNLLSISEYASSIVDGCAACRKTLFLKLLEIIGFFRKVVVEIEAQSHFQPNSVTC